MNMMIVCVRMCVSVCHYVFDNDKSSSIKITLIFGFDVKSQIRRQFQKLTFNVWQCFNTLSLDLALISHYGNGQCAQFNGAQCISYKNDFRNRIRPIAIYFKRYFSRNHFTWIFSVNHSRTIQTISPFAPSGFTWNHKIKHLLSTYRLLETFFCSIFTVAFSLLFSFLLLLFRHCSSFFIV